MKFKLVEDIDTLDKVIDLQKEMDTWDYGVVQDGNKFLYDDNNISKVDWGRYVTYTINELTDIKLGTCWDFTNYEYYKLRKLGLNPKAYFIMLKKTTGPWTEKTKDNEIDTHSFVTVNVENDTYWIESAWWNNRGVHKINSLWDVISRFDEQYGSDKEFDLYEYDPTGMDGLSMREYSIRAQQKKVLSRNSS